MRLFARRQRRYILAYHALDNFLHAEEASEAQKPEKSCTLIEAIVTKFSKPHKTHRNILDQDGEFVDGILGKMRNAASGELLSMNRMDHI